MATDKGGNEEEWLLRRIPEEWGPNAADPRPSPLAFRPHRERDADGLSLYRESVVQPEDLAGWGRAGKVYFVARVRLSVLRAWGMSVLDKPDGAGRPGHVVVPEMTAANRKEARQVDWQRQLADGCLIVGPLPGFVDED